MAMVARQRTDISLVCLRITASVAALAAWVASPTPGAAATVRDGRIVMGTILEVVVVADDQPKASRLADEAFDVALGWERVLTTWREDGELLRLNRSAGHGPVAISRELADALRMMIALSMATGGRFDPGVGSMVARLRAGASTSEPIADDLQRIERVLRLPSPDTAELRAGAELDAGGIGKGIALDAVARHLRERGARAAFLDFGSSSILAFGLPEDRRAWSVVVAGDCAGSMLGTIDLVEGSLSTSRTVAANDPAGAIIDPRTGTVVRDARLATILAATATDAEAWSKALVVSGAEVLPLARSAGVEALIAEGNRITATPGFLRWLPVDAGETHLNRGRWRSPRPRSPSPLANCNRPR